METPKENKPEEPVDLLTRSENIAKRIEEANKKAEEILNKNEQTLSRIMLSGRAEAGQTQQKPKEETPKEYKDRIMRGG